MSVWPVAGERRRLQALERLFDDSECRQTHGPSIRITGHGIWVPTPFSVLVDLLRSLKARGFFRARGSGRNLVLDVGAGDGRVLALLAFFEPDLEVIGIESDERLYRQAETNLESLSRRLLLTRPERLRLVRADYRRLAEASHGLRMEDVAFVFNYPDGNQIELERFVIEKTTPGVNLCLLTHDRELRLGELELISEQDVAVSDSTSPWRFSVYSA